MNVRAILTSKEGYFTLWLFLLGFLIYNTENNFISILFSISTFLLFSHIIFGGYYLFKRIERIGYIQIIATIIITALIPIGLVKNVNNSINWFIFLIMIMFTAIIYHSTSKMLTSKDSIKKFCNYKILIETQGLVFGLIGLILVILFPSWTDELAIINLLTIIWLNWKIFKDRKLYNEK